MDFITKLPTASKQHDFIMVVVDKLFKVTHFIHVNPTNNTDNITNIFLREIFKLHGLPKAIVFDKDTMFSSNF
jgi:hypothetical protein